MYNGNVLLTHLYTAAALMGSMRRTLCSKLFKRALRSVQRECPTYTPLYSSSINSRLYAQNPMFEIVHGESVIVYLYIYSGNVQQNPLCVESSCVS